VCISCEENRSFYINGNLTNKIITMKKFILILIFISVKSFSADWDLFPLGQRSFYNYPFSNKMSMELYVMDSVVQNGTSQSQLFRKKLPNMNFGSCNTDSLYMRDWQSYSDLHIDSLSNFGDTTFYNSFETTSTFYFVNNATIGQSWTIASLYPGNGYSITITLDSLVVETFLGITDSVKVYSMTPNGTIFGQTPISNFKMKLSKNYGFIEFVPFIQYLVHPSSVNFFSMQLIGLDNGSVRTGYIQPEFLDYFHLSIGDILYWEDYHHPDNIMNPTYTQYFRDSITDVFISPDSVVYTFDRMIEDRFNVITLHPGWQEVFRKNEFGPLVEAAPVWYAFEGTDNPDYYYFWKSNEVILLEDSTTGDTISEVSLRSEMYPFIPSTCELGFSVDYLEELIVNTKVGVSRYGFYLNSSEHSQTLTGYRISGVQSGNITLDADEIVVSSQLSIFPNPSKEYISISANGNISNAVYFIYSLDGKNIKTGDYNGGEISLKEFVPGIYFVKLISKNKNYIGRFVKE